MKIYSSTSTGMFIAALLVVAKDNPNTHWEYKDIKWYILTLEYYPEKKINIYNNINKSHKHNFE